VPCCATDATPEDQSCCHCDKDTGMLGMDERIMCLKCCLMSFSRGKKFFEEREKKLKDLWLFAVPKTFALPFSTFVI